jgi:hypothetical protein
MHLSAIAVPVLLALCVVHPLGVGVGVGVRRRMGPVRLFAEMRYHPVTRQFEEAENADTFVPVSVGVVLGR